MATEPPADDIGAVVKRLRTERGASMRALAASAGVSQPFLSKLESGRLLPSLSTLYALADALGVSPSELLPAVDDSTASVIHLSASDSARTPRAQLLAGGPGRATEAYLFTADAGDSDDVDFAHGGEEFVFVLEGCVVLTQDGRDRRIPAGGSVTLDPTLPHRWSAAEATRYLLVTTRTDAAPAP
ncbi:XRE family transcriptional regulator [Galbitalea sp. SE-J8]|uniref:helix-turn-helix domain-containing protein n=1 Tax=Galbitalea sp. SE-J8 TaxID=3054952 RepID=UPI00259C7524|nr:XRE family transcriptional regulator [Galbitalea sp. SE-J8]MDM4762386.1 XRE family transcriptional regulator [Galbitalea sp. SE-J8]